MRWSGLVLSLGLAVAALHSTAAVANCQKPTSSQELIQDLGAANAALRAQDAPALRTIGKRLESSLPCVAQQVPPAVFASTYRSIAASRVLSGDLAGAGPWLRIAAELDPAFEFDATEVPMGHPLRVAFDEARAATGDPSVKVDGQTLVVPDGALLLLDGRPLKEPAATLGRPHLFQVVAQSDKSVRQAFIIDGNAFPASFLAAAAVAAADPKAEKDASKKAKQGAHQPNFDLAVVQVQRVRPPAKTPLMLAGGAIALVGAGLYGYTFKTSADFDAATTTAEMARLRSLNNTMVIAAGGTALLGVGVGYAGILLDAGGGGIVWRGRF